jgi:hypothetical protein
MQAAYVARIESTDGKFLLGGVKATETYPFAERADAVQCAEIKIDIEKSVGHSARICSVRKVRAKNPILHSEL